MREETFAFRFHKSREGIRKSTKGRPRFKENERKAIERLE